MAKTAVRKDPLRVAIAAQAFPAKGIVQLFKPRPKISFCLAFVDTAAGERSLLTDIKKFRSNIAKYALIELGQDLGLMGFDFKVVQIEK